MRDASRADGKKPVGEKDGAYEGEGMLSGV